MKNNTFKIRIVNKKRKENFLLKIKYKIKIIYSFYKPSPVYRLCFEKELYLKDNSLNQYNKIKLRRLSSFAEKSKFHVFNYLVLDQQQSDSLVFEEKQNVGRYLKHLKRMLKKEYEVTKYDNPVFINFDAYLK